MKSCAEAGGYDDAVPSALSATSWQNTTSISERSQDEQPFIPVHPLKVKPFGNKYGASNVANDHMGSFTCLSDEILMTLLEHLDAGSLLKLSSSCKALYAFCRSDELWKNVFLECFTGELSKLKWRGSWRSTYLNLLPERESHIMCNEVFSDGIYRPFLCAHTPLVPYTTNIPNQNAIARLNDLSLEDFATQWCDKPFILTQPVKEWPVYESWDTSKLLEKYQGLEFRAEAVDWPLKLYVEYMNHNSDESPLYLFDRSFVEKMELAVGRDQPDPSYWIPDCFGEDLFTVLGTQRPDSRWLIVGPARSGSTFHKDPNATSAWNAVLRGSKYWIMFPNSVNMPPPPGVYVSEDQSEVTSPLSIAEWLIGFHAEARRTPGCVEGVCGEGEVLHVPSNWWHLVVNLDASIAITQNFVPGSHLPSVLSFLRDKPDQVSGFKKDVADPYALFVKQLEKTHPEILSQALEQVEQKTLVKKRKWDDVQGSGNAEIFSFGFGGDGHSDEDIP